MRSFVCLVLAAASCFVGTTAHAGKSTFRTYNAEQGLASLGGGCFVQAPGGFILVCTESGIFAYDGRRFDNLGTDQGLRPGGAIYDIAVSGAGRIAVRFADEILVSDRATDASHAPGSLSFQTIIHPGLSFYDDSLHRLVAWQDGFAFLAGDALEKVVVAGGGAPKLEVMPYDPVERAALAGAAAIFAVDGHLWLAAEGGRLCAADPGHVRCYGAADGLRGADWSDVVAGSAGQVLARSATSVATFDPASRRWSVADLPDQGGRYRAYPASLGLYRTPDGGLITQADHGLAMLGPQGWRGVSIDEGAPSGTIVSAMTDATGQLWFHVFGQGLKRWVGFGRWETFQRSEGLSDGITWRTARAPGGHLWVSTDTGIDEIGREGASLKLLRVIPEASYALAVGPHGRLWSGIGRDGAMIVEPVSGAAIKVEMPAVNAIASGSGDDVWLGTRSGLFKALDQPGKVPRPQLAASGRTEVIDVVGDASGGVYYLSSGRLRHHRQDGTDVPVVEEWPARGFEPVSLARDHNGAVWVGGAGGLFRFTLSADAVRSVLSVPASDTLSNSVVAIMVDHRGWVWAGTSRGLSVFDGQRWVSLDVDSGLVANDVDQGGIREDADGSVWITTVEGVAHLLDPRWLFAGRPAEVLVSGAVIGDRAVSGTMPYSTQALSVQFGTPSYGAERSISFRYSLSGVDAGTAESSSGLARYAFVPPGRHVLTVTAYNQMTHEESAPTRLVIDMAFPWWRQWWAEVIWAASALGLAFGAVRLRFHAVMARQAELERHVARATEMLRYDGLTGLLNRREIEKYIAGRLADGCDQEMIVALLDVDHFKQVNDIYGHLGGDDVLRTLARLVLADIWEGERAGRYGGEEFLLVLDDEDGRGAERVLHLLHAIRGTPFNAAGASVRVTCSIGLAWAAPGDDWESLLGRADEALYAAKAAGRDRVVERGRTGVSREPQADRGLRLLGAGRSDRSRAGRLHPSAATVARKGGDQLGAV